jgi:hypothetical protein
VTAPEAHIEGETIVKVSEKISHNHNPLVLVMAIVAGTGVVLMILAAAIGVIQGAAADGTLIGVLFVGGLGMLVAGSAAWVMLTQPQNHFDDISQPLDDGHGHGHDDHADEHAIVPTGEQHPVAHH